MTNWESVIGEQKQQADLEAARKREELKSQTKGKDGLGSVELEIERKTILATQDSLGEYLVNTFLQSIQYYPNIKFFMRNFAPFVLNFDSNPNYRAGSYGSSQMTVSFVSDMDSNLLEKVLMSVAPEGLDKLDIFPKKDKCDFSYLFPEYNSVKEFSNSLNIGANSPYVPIMMMAPIHRPLMAIATKRYLETNRASPNQNGFKPVLSFTPNLETVLNVAKEFNIKNFGAIVKSFNDAVQKSVI